MANEKNHETKKLKGGKKTDWKFVAQIAAIAVLAGLLIYNVFPKGTYTIGTVSASDVIPKGVPAVYGKELGVSYDDVSPSNPQTTEATINKLASFEDMQLGNTTMQRYIRIAGSISCEYCCDAQALIFSDGSRACGCSHSYAMRGLAKYLLTKHPEMSDSEILSELGKWKTLFFPGILQNKAKALQQNGISLDYVNLASNKYRGIENGQSSGEMVGDC